MMKVVTTDRSRFIFSNFFLFGLHLSDQKKFQIDFNMRIHFPLPEKKKIVPGEPQDVRVNAANSTTIHVAWKPPLDKDKNGIIMGYHIHVQETKEEVCVKISL